MYARYVPPKSRQVHPSEVHEVPNRGKRSLAHNAPVGPPPKKQKTKTARRKSELSSVEAEPEHAPLQEAPFPGVEEEVRSGGGGGEVSTPWRETEDNEVPDEKGHRAKERSTSRAGQKSKASSGKKRHAAAEDDKDQLSSTQNETGKEGIGTVARKSKKGAPSKGHGTSGAGEDVSPPALSDKHPENSKHRGILARYHQSALGAQEALPSGTIQHALAISDTNRSNETNDHRVGLEPLPQPASIRESTAKPSFSALPPWLEHPILVSSDNKLPLQDIGITPKFVSLLQAHGYGEALPIQAAVIPLLLAGAAQHDGDICISAATGSGKTLAYMLPLVESMRDRIVVQLRGVVVVPTRELVNQARDVCEMCCSDLGLQVQTAVGSRPFKREQDDLVDRSWQYDPTGAKQAGKPLSLDDGSTYDFALDDLPSEETSRIPPGHVVEYQSKVDILICTPGRLVDHIQNTPGFTLDHVRWLVIDEADTLLSQTFQGWIDIVTGTLERERSMDELRADEKILRKLDFRRPQRVVRKVVLSATMTRDVSKLSALKLRRPKFVALESSVRVSSAKEKEGEEREAAVGGDGDDDDAHETFELPSSLCEWAVPVGDGSDKPLYLIELLQKKILRDPAPNLSPPRSMAADGPHSTSSRHSSAEATSSDDSDSSSSSGSSSSERSRPPPTPATMEDGAHPAAAHKDGAAPANDDRHGVLIFTRSNESALRLTRLLTLLQPGYGSMMGTLTSTHASAQRRKTLQAFARTKQLSILIASDLVARGLDLPHLAHVINYDVPGSVRTYVHRVGRTARAHRPGQAWSLVTDREAAWFWNAIARGSRLRRQPGRRVVKQKLRLNLDLDRDRDRDRDREETSVGRKEAYEKALRVLAEEVRGAR